MGLLLVGEVLTVLRPMGLLLVGEVLTVLRPMGQAQ